MTMENDQASSAGKLRPSKLSRIKDGREGPNNARIICLKQIFHRWQRFAARPTVADHRGFLTPAIRKIEMEENNEENLS